MTDQITPPPELEELTDEELESIARAAEIQHMKEHGGLTASTPDGIHAQLRAQRIAGLRAAAYWQLEQVIKVWEQCMEESGTDIQVIRRFEQKLKAMRPTQEDN